MLNRLQEIGVRSLRPKATVLTACFFWYIHVVSSMSMLQTRNVTWFLLGQVGVVHRRSKIGAASNGLIIIIIDECKNPKIFKHV